MRAIRQSLMGVVVLSSALAPVARAEYVLSSSNNSRAYAGIVQSDGKIVACGAQYGSKGDDTLAMRFQSSGALDYSKTYSANKTGQDQALACAQQSDGKLVLAGNSAGKFEVIRLNVDGSLDSTFNRSGMVNLSLSGSAWGVALSGSTIYVAGSPNSNGSFEIAKLSSSGSIQAQATTSLGGSYSRAKALAIQSDGKIVVGGGVYNGSNYDFGLVRYNADLSLDSSFGAGGKLVLSLSSDSDEVQSVQIQSDGMILAAGYSLFNDTTWAVARFDSSGALDPSFGNAGVKLFDLHSQGAYGQAFGMALQGDGSIVLTGIYRTPSTPNGNLAAMRILSNGSEDASFNGGAFRVLAIGNYGTSQDVAIQSDGKIVLFGQSTNASGTFLTVARLLGDGSDDPSFH